MADHEQEICEEIREKAMKKLYECQMVALHKYVDPNTIYPASWDVWLVDKDVCWNSFLTDALCPGETGYQA